VGAQEGGVNLLEEALIWINDPLNWTNPGGILDRLGEHLLLSAAAVALACLVAWPTGIWLGHRGAGGSPVVVISNLTLAIPVLATLTLLVVAFDQIGRGPVIVAMAIFAVPPLLANAYTGVREVDPEVREAALGMGLSGRQLLVRVELPLAVPYLAAGFRTASVQVVATVTLAVFVNGGGLGHIIAAGFGLGTVSGAGQIIAGGFLVAALALLVEGALALGQRAVTPRPIRRTRITI
jgi:osmoprotectant transport system permease protein